VGPNSGAHTSAAAGGRGCGAGAVGLAQLLGAAGPRPAGPCGTQGGKGGVGRALDRVGERRGPAHLEGDALFLFLFENIFFLFLSCFKTKTNTSK